MSETVGDRVRKVRKAHALTQKEFGDSLSIANSSVCLLEKNKLGRTTRTLNAICKEYGVSMEWLLTGEGEMYADNDLVIEPSLAYELKKIHSLLETAKISAKHMDAEDWANLNEYIEVMED